MYQFSDAKRPKLDPSERSQIRDLLQSEGWKVLVKIWGWQRGRLLYACTQEQKDHRFWQGQYAGFELAQSLAEHESREPPVPVTSNTLSEMALSGMGRGGDKGI